MRLHISKIIYFLKNSVDELKERMVTEGRYISSLENNVQDISEKKTHNTLDEACGKNLLKWTK